MLEEAEEFDTEDAEDDEQHNQNQKDVEGVRDDSQEGVEHFVSEGYLIQHYIRAELRGR